MSEAVAEVTADVPCEVYELCRTMKLFPSKDGDDGIRRSGAFVELQTKVRGRPDYVRPDDMKKYLSNGYLSRLNDAGEEDQGSTRIMWDDIKAMIADEGEIETLNFLNGIVGELDKESLASIKAGVRRNKDLKYRPLFAKAVAVDDEE